MPKKKNVNIKYTSRDFKSIKEDLVQYAKRYYPDSYKDFSEAGFGSMLFDTVAYVGDVLSYYLDYSVNESFMDTAIEQANVRKHARALGYNYAGIPSVYGTVSFYILCPSNSEGTAPDRSYLPVLKRGAYIGSNVGANFILTEDIDFKNVTNEFVAARFDPDSGGTTYFAVKAFGQVRSGRFFETQVDISPDFEKFRKVRIGSSAVSDIHEVYDSSGNKYYEVDNLAQEVIFIETTNKNAASDGVRSILKPFVATRRFTVQQDDNGTYLQFGFGSDEEDTTGLVEPSKIALKMHGKNTISSNSFDPTKLLSTNKLGLSPYNTSLTVVFRINDAKATQVSTNSLSNITRQRMTFQNEETLDVSKTTDVINSLECTNEQVFASQAEDISIEELKQRAAAHYATQGRAVTKQDYESLAYNMPSKFGAIRRANIVNDPSSSNRKLSLYVVSQDGNGFLAPANNAVKNNLKNWISRFKIMNDTINIFDAKIVNISVEFLAQSDPRFDTDKLMNQCINAIEDYFSDDLYIGEPLYLTRMYEILNRIDGIVDVKKVKIKNKVGGSYSSVSLNLNNIISKEGTYLQTPRNVIFELKQPSLNIKGTIV